MIDTHDRPRVWVGSLGAYNAGHLIGQWTDATDAEELQTVFDAVQQEAIKTVGPLEAGEEYMLADREGFGDLIGEYTPFERVAELGALIEEHGPAFVAYAENIGADYADADSFEEAYSGEWDSFREFAEDLAEQLDAIPKDARWPVSHIDWDSAANELAQDYETHDAPGGGVYVFRII